MEWLSRIVSGIASLFSGGLVTGLDPRVAFVIGLLLAVVLAWVVFQVRVWWTSAGAVMRPQRIVQSTAQSPWQVFWGSVGSTLRLFGTALLVAGILMMLFITGDPLPGAIASGVGVAGFGLGWLVG